MYCILVTGIPAAGKSTMAQFLSERLSVPIISKDKIKELLFDDVGFRTREEKVKLGIGSMNIMYYMAEQLMQCNQPFILENNFEHASQNGLNAILEQYSYKAITVTLTGDYQKIYERFVERNESVDRHRGHVVNNCYPEKMPGVKVAPMTYESYVSGIANRGMDSFTSNGPHIVVDTTDFLKIDKEELIKDILEYQEVILGENRNKVYKKH